eukprot:TRINITY_DN6137_c0_g1_i1.p1 TRINITY_DN6137_c0_g1~~TRINITY_DN6137_c0_g1_i1.p1  ORF type:complete len:808 (-),score=200.63 TRINITY_DN6137_c0_g1_i1:86-2509(-)
MLPLSPARTTEGCEEHYEVIRPIGSGSFGQVFLVFHRLERTQYVMKKIAMMATLDAKKREATELEVRLLSELRHPNIVSYRDSFIDREGFFLIMMEYCEHGDLFSYMQEAKESRRMLDEKSNMDWFIQIVLALSALHTKKILHRDLKTQNIFLTGCKERSNFALKLGDFGIAKVLDTTCDLARTQIGTPFYMSPELINNKPYSYKSDVWGVGCVLYEIVNGQRAFDAQSLNGLALKIIKGQYTPITSACSSAVKNLIKSMLSKNPAHRPTLKEILHLTHIRRQLPQCIQNVISANTGEAKLASNESEQLLVEQLTALGLGGLVNCPGPRRDRKRLLERLEKAELSKQREEAMLQRTVALLEQCLQEPDRSPKEQSEKKDRRRSRSRGPSKAASAHVRMRSKDAVEEVTYAQGGSWHDDDIQRVPPPPPPAPPEAEFSESHGETLYPAAAMSQRDRVLWQKEKRREEEQQRFEKEAQRIREENLAYSKARNHGGRSHAEVTPASSVVSGFPGRQRAATDFTGPPPHGVHELTQEPHQSHSRFPHRPKVMNSPRHRTGSSLHPRGTSPSPPPPQFGEPVPPQEPSRMWSSWRTQDGPPQPHSRPLHSVCLKSLTAERWQQGVSEAEDSETSDSLSEIEDGWSDYGEIESGEEKARRRTVALQQRIDQCQAAINRHRMKIEMLKYDYAQEVDGDSFTARSRAASLGPGEPPHHDKSARRPGGIGGTGGVPAVVQDCMARLVRRCLEGLGSTKFHAAKRALQQSVDASDLPSQVRMRMIGLLGIEKVAFLSLLDQIVHMERRWGGAAQEVS